MWNLLITGGAGFIGSHVAERLLGEGHRVWVLDNFDRFYDPALKRRNVEAASKSSSYTLIEGDIRDRECLERVFDGARFDAVIHLAARAGVRPSIADPVLYTDVNLIGTSLLLESCRTRGVTRFIFGSSSSVYGNNEKVPFSEDDPVDTPVSPYAATKRAGELLCHTFHHLFGMEVACLRFFTVYGPRQRPEMAIHRFTRLIADGEVVDQYGDGSTARDYTYISDVVEGIMRALQRCRSFHIWNLGGSRTTRLSDLIRMIGDGLAIEPKIRQRPMQPGDVERTWADVTRAGRELAWAPKVPLERGLGLFLEWFKAERARSG
jgi:UDP-glucuronate 4-epimerase